MSLSYNPKNNMFILKSDDAQKAKAAGFTFSTKLKGSKGEKTWFSDCPYAALPFIKCADKKALSVLEDFKDDFDASRAVDSDISFPRPEGLDYMPFQKAGIAYALRKGNVLIGDEMGLGKTVQAIGIANAIGAKKILVICPASIRLNWQREIKKWSTLPRVSTYPVLSSRNGVRTQADYVIISYNLASSEALHEVMCEEKWDLLILDESHYLKSPTAKRTRSIFGGGRDRFKDEYIAKHSKKIVALTGTPIPNRPRECLGENTLVLTKWSWKRIVDVKIEDEVWDGVEWVKHSGIQYQGVREVKNLAGISVTADHNVRAKSSWVSVEEVLKNRDMWNQVLERGSKNLPSLEFIEEPCESCKPELLNWKPVFDLMNAGPRRRFTILSNEGPIIAHNCYTIARGLCWESVDWMSYDQFCHRFNPIDVFSNGHRNERKGRLPELQSRLRSNFMIRRLKKDVLKDLPDKRYEFSYIEPNGRIKEILAKEKLIDFEVTDLKDPFGELWGMISTIRREMGEAKLPRVVEHLKYLLDIVEVEKVVVFSHHKVVMDGLKEALDKYGLVQVRGGMSQLAKQNAIDDFVEGDARIFSGQLDAAGFGIDGLQKRANHVVFAEPAWTPGTNEQAVDRCHRIGQHDNVIAQFLIVEGGLDERVLSKVLEKSQTIHSILDEEH